MPGPFRFRFDTLLALRKQREDEKKRLVAARLRLIGEVRRRQDEMTRAIADQTRTLRASLREGALDVDQLRWGRHWLSHLRRGVLEAEGELATHRAMLAQERGVLIEARKETQVLARLKERRREDYLAEVARAEQIETDEISAARFARIAIAESEAPV